MKKVVNFIVILSLFIVTFVPINRVQAQTLGNYKSIVAELERKKDETTRMSKEAANKIENARKAVENANSTIKDNEEKVADSKALVTESEEKINIKSEELKDVINVLQYTEINSTDMYLEYIFNATSISELIERNSIVEQIVNYTNEEITDLEKLIEDNKSLQTKLANDNVNLADSITTHEKQMVELENTIKELAVVGLDYKEEIEAKKSLIKIYEEAGCKDNDDIQKCYYDKLQGSASFSRPTNSGYISQKWSASHGAMDLGVSKGTNIYAPADGTVVFVRDGIQYLNKYKERSCGGHVIYMHHKVAGKEYTTEFAHLTSYFVKNGQKVKKGQIIGTSGGDSSTVWYDRCTFGPHLHYAISSGFYFTSTGYGTEFNTFKRNTSVMKTYSVSGLKDQTGWRWKTRTP